MVEAVKDGRTRWPRSFFVVMLELRHQTMGSFSPAVSLCLTHTHTDTRNMLHTEAPCPGSSCCSCRTIFASYYFITRPFLLLLRPPLLPIYSATLFPPFFFFDELICVCVQLCVSAHRHHCHLYLGCTITRADLSSETPLTLGLRFFFFPGCIMRKNAEKGGQEEEKKNGGMSSLFFNSVEFSSSLSAALASAGGAH